MSSSVTTREYRSYKRKVAKQHADKIENQIAKAGLPKSGAVHFEPQLETNKAGKLIIKKETVLHGPKKGKRGYVDTLGRIWIKDRAHAGDPEHWDVQEGGGVDYFRIDQQGNLLP